MGEHNFFYKSGKPVLEAFVSLNDVNGDEALKNSTSYKWYAQFKNS
jgi:hypothetical protein